MDCVAEDGLLGAANFVMEMERALRSEEECVYAAKYHAVCKARSRVCVGPTAAAAPF